jgi:hypothetical protein
MSAEITQGWFDQVLELQRLQAVRTSVWHEIQLCFSSPSCLFVCLFCVPFISSPGRLMVSFIKTEKDQSQLCRYFSDKCVTRPWASLLTPTHDVCRPT